MECPTLPGWSNNLNCARWGQGEVVFQENVFFFFFPFPFTPNTSFIAPNTVKPPPPSLIGIQGFIRQSSALRRELQAIVSRSLACCTWPDTKGIQTLTFRTHEKSVTHTGMQVLPRQLIVWRCKEKGRRFKALKIDSPSGRCKWPIVGPLLRRTSS